MNKDPIIHVCGGEPYSQGSYGHFVEMEERIKRLEAVAEAAKDLELLDEDGDRFIPIWKRDALIKALADLERE